jgi:hypothetical protein
VVAGLDDEPPRLLVADPVGTQTALLLERLHRSPGVRAEDAGVIVGLRPPERTQPALEVSDPRTARTGPEGQSF